MNKTIRNLLAICIAILPVNIWMIWYRLTQTENFTTLEMLVYPLVVGGGLSVLILWLNKVLVKSTFKKTFNPAKETVSSDIVMGILLMLVFFLMFWIEKMTIYRWFPSITPQSTELSDTVQSVANSPFLMFVWLGPVLWIGIALFEELSRIFMLKCLWNISNNKTWQFIAIFITSLLIGFVHIYQGTAGIISITLKSLLMCFYFYKFKRILPLIISHGLYDALQIIALVGQFG